MVLVLIESRDRYLSVPCFNLVAKPWSVLGTQPGHSQVIVGTRKIKNIIKWGDLSSAVSSIGTLCPLGMSIGMGLVILYCLFKYLHFVSSFGGCSTIGPFLMEDTQPNLDPSHALVMRCYILHPYLREQMRPGFQSVYLSFQKWNTLLMPSRWRRKYH